MNFAEALQALFDGKRITRPGLDGAEIFQKETKAGKVNIKTLHRLSKTGHESGWTPKNGDVYTEDWRIV